MLFSVVVATYNRPEPLRSLLAALAAQELAPGAFEVIVVDDGSTPPVARPRGPRHNVRHFRTPNRGPGAARNSGAFQARGRYLVFTDDDCTPAPNWLTHLAQAVRAHPAAAIAGTTVTARLTNIYAEVTQGIHDYAHAAFNAGAAEPAYFTTCNVALPRAAFLELGGFDEGLRTAEDRDLCQRWLAAGRRLVLQPAAVVSHAHPMGFFGFLKQHFGYGRGALRLRRLARLGDRATLRPASRALPQGRRSFLLRLPLWPFTTAVPKPRQAALAGLSVVSQAAAAAGALLELCYGPPRRLLRPLHLIRHSALDPTRIAIAVPCHNEAQNLRALLEALVLVRFFGAPPAQILVVCDGSTDGSLAIARTFAARSPVPVTVSYNEQARGKSAVANQFIEILADADVILSVNADIRLAPDCLARMVAAFADPEVGVVGARPVPCGPERNWALRVSEVLWAMHHYVALRHPKATEISAFRRLAISLEPDCDVDEAELERLILAAGYRIAYVPEALIYNQSPLTLRDYVRQRTRVTVGHLAIGKATGYSPQTLAFAERLGAVGRYLREAPGPDFAALMLAIALEAFIMAAGVVKFRRRDKGDGTWVRIDSAKRAFGESDKSMPRQVS